jgi:molybdopterin/thiamine biosynthesis adenylyltransferase
MELDRQATLNLNTPHSVCIAGAGGIGNWVALYLTLMGVRRFYIFDNDKVEVHNLNRTIYSKLDIGKEKVFALKTILEKLRDIEIFAFNSLCTPTVLNCLADEPQALIDCTDKLDSQVAMSKWCTQHGVRYIRAGATTNHITVTSSVETWGNSKQEQCGITIPSWVAPVALVAAYAVDKLALNPELEISLSLEGDNYIPTITKAPIEEQESLRHFGYSSSDLLYTCKSLDI